MDGGSPVPTGPGQRNHRCRATPHHPDRSGEPSDGRRIRVQAPARAAHPAGAHDANNLLVSRALGLVLGLLVANLLPCLSCCFLWRGVVLLKPLLAVISNVFFGILGSNLAAVHGRTLLRLFNPSSTEALLVADGVLTPATAKILDTSVIIDGRIRGMLACGLLEGQVIVAETVISEIQQLSIPPTSRSGPRPTWPEAAQGTTGDLRTTAGDQQHALRRGWNR